MQSFIEVYINGEKKKNKEKQNKDKEKLQIDENQIMTIRNFSLLSDSNFSGGFFNEKTKNLTERIYNIKEKSKSTDILLNSLF